LRFAPGLSVLSVLLAKDYHYASSTVAPVPFSSCSRPRARLPQASAGDTIGGARGKTVDGLITRLGSSGCPRARALQPFTIITLLLVSLRCPFLPLKAAGGPPNPAAAGNTSRKSASKTVERSIRSPLLQGILHVGARPRTVESPICSLLLAVKGSGNIGKKVCGAKHIQREE